MKVSKFITAVAVAIGMGLIGTVGQAKGATLYNNGLVNGNVQGWGISSSNSVSDTFTLASPATLMGAQVGLWVTTGDAISTVDWSIGSTAFGSDLAPVTTTSLTNTFQFTNGFPDDVYESTFPMTVSLGAGTYWLTLQNGVSSPIKNVFWDQSSGPSSAVDSSAGTIPSESFQIYGNVAVNTPEPASLGILGVGAIGLLARRRRNA